MAQHAERRVRVRHALTAAVVAWAAFGTGCHRWHTFTDRVGNMNRYFSSSYDDPKAEAKLAEAEQLFAAGDYDKAQGIFKELADNTGNSALLAEQSRFMQAECRRLRGHYPEAVDTYHKMLMDFPTGPHRREACARMFEICDYWMDDFRDELTARKDEKGVLRWKPGMPNAFDRSKPFLDQEGRMLEALERIHTQDPIGPTADNALFWCGYVNFIRGNFQEADHFFSTLVELHKDSKLRPQAIAYAIQAKNNATGGAVYDTRKCAEALQLVHMAETTVPELANNPEMAEKLTKAKFAIRYQQAEKDYKTAEYYERTGHPGSAVFYYELVRRRYAGTWYADRATERKEWVMKQVEEGKPPTGNDPWAVVQAKWGELFGPKGEKPDPDAPPADGKVRPAGGVPPAPAPAGKPIGGKW